jgi:hypothetical protein
MEIEGFLAVEIGVNGAFGNPGALGQPGHVRLVQPPFGKHAGRLAQQALPLGFGNFKKRIFRHALLQRVKMTDRIVIFKKSPDALSTIKCRLPKISPAQYPEERHRLNAAKAGYSVAVVMVRNG